MQKIDSASEEVLPKSLDFFRTDPVTVAYQQSTTVAYHTQNPLATSPITFRINTGQSYVDFSKCYLVTSFKITKKDGDKQVQITKDDPVSFIQNFGGTFIKSLRVLFNGKQVYNSNELYPYNSYLRRRLGLGVPRTQEYLQMSGYFEDGLDQMTGEGFEARRALYENGAQFETVCSIDADIFLQKKLLLNQMVVEIEITPHNNFFALLNTGKNEYKYSIVDCKLYTKQHLLVPQLDSVIQETLNKDILAKFSYTKHNLRNFFIGHGRQDFSTVLYNDFLPKRVFAALVDTRAFNGTPTMSPFNFGTFNLDSIKLVTNSMNTPSNPYEFKWHKKEYARAYKDLGDALDNSHGISIEKYLKHSAIFAFDLQAQHNLQEAQKIGATSIYLTFKEPVQQNGLQLIVLGEFDSIMALDKHRIPITAMSV